jgi:nucleoside-diphosphate-sugar epimerase
LLSIVVERDVRLVHLSIDLVYSGARAGSSSTPFGRVPPLAVHQGALNARSALLAFKRNANDRRRAVPVNLSVQNDSPQAVAHDDHWIGYIESDPTDPVTVYGKTMVAAEQLLADWMPEACILRISLPMGVSFNGHAGAIDWIQSRFRKNRPATLYFDEIRTPAYTDCLNRLYERVLASDVAGLYHAGGPRALSLYQIAQIVNRVGGYDPALLMGCPRKQAGPIPPRAGNVTMNSQALAEALGDDPLDAWPYDESLVPTHNNWHYAREGAPGSRERLARVLYRNPRQYDESICSVNSSPL